MLGGLSRSRGMEAVGLPWEARPTSATFHPIRYTTGCGAPPGEPWNQTACPDGCFESDWSHHYTWHGQGLALGAREDDALYVWPGYKSNVTIKACRTVVIDLDVQIQLYSVVVWGRLRIRDRGPAGIVSLRAVCINIKPGGEVYAGEEAAPYAGVLEFLLTGDLLTESHQCGGRKGMHFDVGSEATLQLYGAAPEGQMWGRLRETAEVGATSIEMQGLVNFQVGDRLIIAGTTDGNSATEWVTVTGVNSLPLRAGGVDTRLQLSAPLQHSHLSVSETHGGHVVEMRAEVALYLRPRADHVPPIMRLLDSRDVPVMRSSMIRISGVRPILDMNFRFRAFQGKRGLVLTTAPRSAVVMRGVMLIDIGRKGGARGRAMAGLNCKGQCDIRSCLVLPRLGDGINVKKATGHVENVVFTEFHRGVAASDAVVLNSVFLNGIGGLAMNCPAIYLGGCNVRIQGNAVAGAALGISSHGHAAACGKWPPLGPQRWPSWPQDAREGRAGSEPLSTDCLCVYRWCVCEVRGLRRLTRGAGWMVASGGG